MIFKKTGITCLLSAGDIVKLQAEREEEKQRFWLVPSLVFHALLEPKKPIFILPCHLYVHFCLFLAMAATLIHL